MFLRRVLTVLLFTITAIVAKAQSTIGIESGLTGGYLNTNISNRESSSMAYRLGYNFDIPFEYQFNNWLSVETNPGIIQKNYSINRTDSLSGAYSSFINTYFQAPVMLKFVYAKKKLKFFADAGFFYGYWLNAKIRGKAPNIFTAAESNNSSGQTSSVIHFSTFDQKYSFDDKTDNRSECGWVAGIGVQSQINEQYMAFASLRIYESLTSQQKNYTYNQVPQYNETLSLSVGVMLSLK